VTVVKIVLAGVIVAAALLVAQHSNVFRRLGVVGSCTTVYSPTGDRAQWWDCKEGVLTGFPSLPADKCSFEVRIGDRERWRCDSPLDSPPSV
jgi:hypothetical protein